MLLAVLLVFVVLLILGGAIFIAQAGIFFCEDGRMMKILLGGYLGLYLVAALLIKVAIPPIPGTGVDMGSVAGSWSRATGGGIPLSVDFSWITRAAFGAKL